MPLLERRVRSESAGGTARAVLTLVGGTGLAMGIVAAGSPVLTRLYLPFEYGTYSVALSILAILITVSCLRYDYAIPLPERDEIAANVLALALGLAVMTSLAGGIVLILLGPSLLVLIGVSSLTPYVGLIAVGQLAGGVVSALTNWAVRTKMFGAIAANRLAQSVALVAVQAGLGLAGLGAAGLLLGDVAGRWAGSTRLARAAWRRHDASLRQVTVAGMRAAATRYRRFPTLSMPSALLNTFAMQLPLLSIVALYGLATGGHYALADRLASLPLTLVAGAVGQVFVSDAARQAHAQPAALRAGFTRTTIVLARAALLPAVLVAILAPILAEPVLGRGWGETGLYIAILTPMYYLTFVAAPTGETLNIVERQDLLLGRESLRFALLGGAVPLAGLLGASAREAVVLLSVAGCLTYAAYIGLSWWAIIKREAKRGGDGVEQPAGGAGSARPGT